MDNDLIKRIQNGSKEDFNLLYNQYVDYSLRAAYAVTKNKIDASDAVQETFIKVYKNILSFDLSCRFKPWFYKILINECTNILRKRQNTISISDYIENDYHASKKDTYSIEENELLYKAISSLNDIIRVPIILKYLNDFTEKEIAAILGINLNTVKSRLFKGREKLRKYISEAEERGIYNG